MMNIRNRNEGHILSPSTASNLHEAILANSYSVVQLLLDNGVDPNISPRLAPSRLIANINEERSRTVLQMLGRVFRSQEDGIIQPLVTAVCNAYHNSSPSKKDSAMKIIKALLKAGANVKNLCHGISFCQIDQHSSLKFSKVKTAAKVALFLKRFPLSGEQHEACCSTMDEVSALLLAAEIKMEDSRTLDTMENDAAYLTTPPSYHKEVLTMLWNHLSDDDSFRADLIFVCPDGKINAHRCVLSATIPYFRIALRGPWKETASSTSEWKTSNPVCVMKAILCFVYTGELTKENGEWTYEDDYDHIRNVLSVALEYQLDNLVQICENIISRKSFITSPDSCKEILTLANYYNLGKLKECCASYIRKNMISTLMHPTFIKLSKENGGLWSELSKRLMDSDNKPRKKQKLI